MKNFASRSNELRKLIVGQIERYNIPVSHICYALNIPLDEFLRQYLNVKDISESRMPDQKIIEVAKIVGLDLRMTIIIRDPEVFEKEIVETKEKLKLHYECRGNKKKGATS